MSAGAPLYDHVRRVGRALLALVPAFIVALPCWSWAWQGTRNASFTSFGRDQGIFQYVAWAITHGDVDYRDVRDVNGPLIHLIHVVFGWFCGRSEHQFRVLDLQVTGVTFAIVGACLPGLTRRVLRKLFAGLTGAEPSNRFNFANVKLCALLLTPSPA